MPRVPSPVRTSNPSASPRQHRALEVTGVALAFAQLAYASACLALSVRGWLDVAALVAIVAVGHFVADLGSGLAHWAGDTLGSPKTFWVGKRFIEPFRNHHTDPTDITRHDFVETNGNSCIVVSLILVPVVALLPARATQPSYWVCALVASTCAWLVATNQFHKWAHCEQPPACVRWLQRAGVVLAPKHHAVHHRAPHDTQYCITSGVMNPLLARVRLFRTFERLLFGRPAAARDGSR